MKQDIKGRTNRVTTLKEIGQRTGCAVSTVSAILNRSPHCYAGDSTREKVLLAARELGYYPNLLYRSLRAQNTRTIGLIAPNLNVQVAMANAEIIESLAWDHKYHLFIGYSQNKVEKEEALLKDFASRRVDGMILMVGPDGNERPVMRALVGQGFPLVAIGTLSSVPMACVSTDYPAGGRLAADHLADLGHKRVAVVSMERKYPTIAGRVKGFAEAARDRGMRVQRIDLPDRQTLEDMVLDGYEAGKKLAGAAGMPTAVFAGNDEIALGLVRSLRAAGKDVPGDVSVIGFDDSLSALYCPVPLTTVRQPRERIARRAFELLIGRIEGGADGDTREFVAPELKVRSSTGPAPSFNRRKP